MKKYIVDILHEVAISSCGEKVFNKWEAEGPKLIPS